VLFGLSVCLSSRAALDWQPGPGYRSAALAIPAAGKAGFSTLPPTATGVTFTNELNEMIPALNRITENGSGVALGDVDGDGWCDLYFCKLQGPNALFRNLGGWNFQDITASAGVACDGQFSTGAVFADIDADGDLDLLVNSLGGGTRSFLNDGKAHFTEITDTRLVRRFGATSLALADIDGDGDLDLYVTNYRETTYKDRPPDLKVEAQMVDGKIVVTPQDRFIPITPREGGVEVWERGERDFLYVNTGTGRFGPVSWTSGSFVDEDGQPLKEPPTDWGLTVMFRDMNDDGTPDIYVCNDFFYSTDKVWLNEAGRRFRAIPRLALRNQSMSSMSIDFADLNRDGYDDFFVSDMLSRTHAWRQRQRPSMLQGLLTLPVTDPLFRPEVPRNTLQLNRGDGTYAEIACLSGLEATEWSWGAIFLDVDLDGYEDLLIPTGNNHDVQDADVLEELAKLREHNTPENKLKNLKKFPPLLTASLAFRNQRDLTFKDASAEWGFDSVGIANGMALADLDNDGDLDVVANNLHAAAGLFRNDATASRVAVRLKGAPPNTRGIGAKIKVFGGPVSQQQEMMCGGRYLSCDDTMRVFAAGDPNARLTIEVTWRGGKRSVVRDVPANRLYEIDEASAGAGERQEAGGERPQSADAPRTPPVLRGSTAEGGQHATRSAPLFEDVSRLLGHTHVDEPFNDYGRQPLLNHRLSQLGPGVAWFDLDGDGWDDLFVSGGRGGQLGAFRNDGKGGFTKLNQLPWTLLTSRDQTTVLGWHPAQGKSALLVGTANYEDGLESGGSVRRFESGTRETIEAIPGAASSTGPLALADIDGDGDLDLFVGGRVLPGRYPAAATSRLWRNEAGQFVSDSTHAALFEKLGLATAAVFSDLDGDGDAELVVACEWGPLRLFRNHAGKLQPWDPALAWPASSLLLSQPSPSALNAQRSTLNSLTGWWTGVTSGDFDGDGRLDLVAANWGRNTRHQSHLVEPLRVYHGDFNGDGTYDLLEAFFDPAQKKIVPWRDFKTVRTALPFLLEHVPSYRAYGQAGVQEILGDRFASAQAHAATTLDSMLFLNRGDHFEARPLPVQAQFAPGFGVCVADLDGDGNEDLFLAQNFFEVEMESARYDAGRGLLLRGDGKGSFSPVSGQESGIAVYGEQRGCAAADYDADGRVDLVVTQNREETKLYRNAQAKPGLRVRLIGPPGNPTGVGAMLRLKFGDRVGPAREVQAGCGYWSQDSAVQVLATPAPATALWVRWPGGKATEMQLPLAAKEIHASWDGKVAQSR
jgi:hypothetical protein